jgi:hypothetical protein
MSGGKCFIGYKRKFIFYIDERMTTKPLADKKAESFFTSTNKIPLSIIKGNRTKDSVERAKNEFSREIAKWRRSKELETPFILQALLSDLVSLVHIGENSRF